jgi:hypothetical protein
LPGTCYQEQTDDGEKLRAAAQQIVLDFNHQSNDRQQVKNCHHANTVPGQKSKKPQKAAPSINQ